ncbi:MAG: hypothetical protein F6K52_19595 [Moorea sp. SIO3H5]|nr:hypothetical protein [Moorena sp. SIO3H5]
MDKGNGALLVVFAAAIVFSSITNYLLPVTYYPLPITETATNYLSNPLLKMGLDHIITSHYQR